MAVNHWYQSWPTPTTNLYAGHSLFTSPASNSNFSVINEYTRPSPNKGRTYHGVANILPYFASLGFLTPSSSPSSPSYSQPPADYPSFRFYQAEQSPVEKTGPFRTLHSWKLLDFVYDSPKERQDAIARGDFIPERVSPLGIETYKDRVFLTMPKWHPNGIPVTLGYVSKNAKGPSPPLYPYPSWEWHNMLSCLGLTSVFRVKADTCGRLWVLDSGVVDVETTQTQACPPAVYIFDLQTDQLLHRYQLPADQAKQDALFTNIIVDIRGGDCGDAHAYISDAWRYSLIVYSLKNERSWRITDHLFYLDPFAGSYNVHGVEFDWVDGIFALALSPETGPKDDRVLYYHPMSSFRIFYALTSVIRNETGWMDVKDAFKVLGESRGPNGQVASASVAKNGVMFYNLVTRDAVGCWDTRKPYTRANQGVAAQDTDTMVFPNDLKIDDEPRQRVWVITNKLPFYLYRKLNPEETNFRVMEAFVDEAVKGGICDPSVKYSYQTVPEEQECY